MKRGPTNANEKKRYWLTFDAKGTKEPLIWEMSKRFWNAKWVFTDFRVWSRCTGPKTPPGSWVRAGAPFWKRRWWHPRLKRLVDSFLAQAQATDSKESKIPSSFLTNTDEVRPAPFEINLGIPSDLPRPSQIHGTIAALKSLLNSYRSFSAFGQNL
jgi:hypothetical protein